MELQTELDELHQANRHVALMRRCVRRQVQLMERLQSQVRDTAIAERLLATMQDTLAVACEHRALVAGLVAQLRQQRTGTVTAARTHG
ncbi:hypothetical protein VOI32_39195 [Paraburkholderia caribensis]|uniref:Uncharacterized protein n=1 Tax=Paraburkholderia caribensis TaxID=75105 RepID=A0ABV0E8Y8_9BURK|nr:hypothetical protein [Paraburkholderia caribensis]MCO4882704.1 hypothetical protein [Paraburkholderia caribensis]